MTRKILFTLYLALLSCASGYLLSKASWIGKVGMTFFYKEYNLLKIWWQGAIAVMMVETIFFLLHNQLHKRLPGYAARVLHALLLLIAIAGLYFTYTDFTHNLAHRILGRRFHLGFYLIWVGWMSTCIFFLLKGSTKTIRITSSDKTETINQ